MVLLASLPYLLDAQLTVDAGDKVDVIQVEWQVWRSCSNRLHVAHVVI